ncbi:MAG TPA: hypothetical protein VK995_00515 [Oceanipulchritudo sp.]|nr:hypothetical protein [Oceanipulchritudo sp.]
MKTLRTIGFISILGGILVHLAVLTVISIQSPLSRKPYVTRAQVEYVGNLAEDAAPSILQQASLLDSAPLFMPTRWNLVSQMADVASLKEATEIFEPFSAQLSLPQAKLALPSDRTAPTGTQEISLPEGPAFFLSRYGRTRTSVPDIVAPGPAIRIHRIAGSADAVPSSRLLPSPLTALSPPAMWGPVQFYLQLSEGILVGLPVLAQSSGFAEWDEVLQGFVGSLDFYRNLGDGYYRLAVFP